ncbi:hypothetical protein [uncultured Eubacterium sp.]|uniref:hypothetical protein n=1 Tax=uncultured Eubacterium sp. TaxID=165185 RepID=UPI00265D0D2B|nr:hypothetical protein [uncultured Eubacterium sp.]
MNKKVLEINSLLDTLQDEDYNTVISFIKFLSDFRKKEEAEKSGDTLKKIQKMFVDDKGVSSEKSMIEDMAKFRRERLGL